MKYQVGDVLLVKKCEWKSRPRPHLHPHFHPHLRPRLKNTVGIITEIEKHSDVFESGSTESDNIYIWLSQVDARAYFFYEDEMECEVLK